VIQPIFPGLRGRKPDLRIYALAVAYLASPQCGQYGYQKEFAYANGVCPRRLNDALNRLKSRLRKAA
jgi:hypothetical protein